MQSIYYYAEESATAKGFVGQVIDSESHKVILRTANAYPSIVWAMEAARKMWEGRHDRIAQTAGLRAVAA
jgi:hypothetical protein